MNNTLKLTDCEGLWPEYIDLLLNHFREQLIVSTDQLTALGITVIAFQYLVINLLIVQEYAGYAITPKGFNWDAYLEECNFPQYVEWTDEELKTIIGD